MNQTGTPPVVLPHDSEKENTPMLNAPGPFASSGPVGSLILAGAPRRLWGLTVANQIAAQRYVMLFDASTVPANGTAPLCTFPVAPNGTIAPQPGSGLSALAGDSQLASTLAFTTACVIASSTTPVIFTAGGATDFLISGVTQI